MGRRPRKDAPPRTLQAEGRRRPPRAQRQPRVRSSCTFRRSGRDYGSRLQRSGERGGWFSRALPWAGMNRPLRAPEPERSFPEPWCPPQSGSEVRRQEPCEVPADRERPADAEALRGSSGSRRRRATDHLPHGAAIGDRPRSEQRRGVRCTPASRWPYRNRLFSVMRTGPLPNPKCLDPLGRVCRGVCSGGRLA